MARPYVQGIRAQRAADTRARIVEAARALVLRSGDAPVDDVARAADVARATIFKQLGGRRGVLTAVEQDAAERAGVYELVERTLAADPVDAVRIAVEGSVRVWHAERDVFRWFYGAVVLDGEMQATMVEKEGQRRAIFDLIAGRLRDAGALADGVTTADAGAALFALTSYATYETLADQGVDGATRVLLRLASALLTARRAAALMGARR